ncbi:MAG: hypothetical protein HW391_1149 [Chloroflexi bacterium]|nr:hypothetical protein [Chloroflexota bacterium]
MRQQRLLAGLALLAAIVAACSQAATTSAPAVTPRPSATDHATASPALTAAPPTATPAPTSEESVPLGFLSPGAYTAHLDPAFTFTLGEGWERREPDPAFHDAYLYLLYAAGDGGELIYIDVVAGADAAERIGAFEHAGLTQVGERRDVTLGGLPAIAIEAGFPNSATVVRGIVGEYVLFPGDVVRATALEVGDRTLVFIIESNADDIETFSPIAEAVLQTVRFP